MLSRPAGAETDLFQALVENSSDAIVLLDARGMVRFVSRSVERVLGYTATDRLARNALELVHPDDQLGLKTVFAECLGTDSGSLTVEARVRHKDGSWRHIEAVIANRIAEAAVGGVVVNYRDVSDRKRAQEALRISEDRLRHLVQTALDLIYYCGPDGRFTFVNPTAARVMGYREAELIGEHFLTLVHPDARGAAADFYRHQIERQEPNTYYEFPAITRDGQTVWIGQHVQLVVEHGTVTGFEAIGRDITRQKEADERLRASEARHRSLIDGAEYAIFRTSLDGRVLEGNPAFVQMLGYDSIDELRVLNMNDVYASQHDRAAMLQRFAREGRGRLSGLVNWRRKDGSIITARLSGRLVEFEGDGVKGFEAIAEDVTARRALEAQLRQSQKMEAVGRLARGIAHDFNNLLAGIMGCANLLESRLAAEDPLHAEAAEIGKAAERGAALTRQLLAFSRRQVQVPQPIDVHHVLHEFERMLQQLGGSSEVELSTPGPPPIVRAEPGQVEQVVMNLVVNARDAMPQGGTIAITAERVELDAASLTRYPELRPGAYGRITVQDTGSGIELEHQRHVFEPFFTTKDPARGGGLGLSIVYGIAKESGGTVTLTSAPGLGSTFEVLMPIADEVRT